MGKVGESGNATVVERFGYAPWVSTSIACCVLFVAGLGFAVSAQAAGYLYSPHLTLQGDCNTGSIDPLPDPGLCPMPPGVAGADHPTKRFDRPCGVAVDRHGYVYVASPGGVREVKGEQIFVNGEIDIFNPQGEFVTYFEDGKNLPCGLAVDSSGDLYVLENNGFNVAVFKPTSFPPTSTTQYGPRVEVVAGAGGCDTPLSVAVDPSDDHLYLAFGCRIAEYGSAAKGWPLLKPGIAAGLGSQYLTGVGVSGNTHEVYASGVIPDPGNTAGQPESQRVYVFKASDGELKCEIKGTPGPGGEGTAPFAFAFGRAGVGVDQSTGDVYVADGYGSHHAVDRFDDECKFIETLPQPPLVNSTDPFSAVALDTPMMAGEAGYDSPNAGYAFVTSGLTQENSYLFAYEPKPVPPAPGIEAQEATGITEAEAVLGAKVNPGGLATTYHFEYVSQADFKVAGYAKAISVPAPEGKAGAGGFALAVSESISGLEPGVAYRFRLVATNDEGTTLGEGEPGTEGEDREFSTYPVETGLADGRSYELVTPPDTNGRLPTMAELGKNSTLGFDTALVSPDGQSLMFGTDGGSLPTLGGNGFHDTYEAVRSGPGSWQSHAAAPSGAQTVAVYPGGISPDHHYSFWDSTDQKGSLPAGSYLRGPDGALEPIGIGSIGQDLGAGGRWISPGGSHVVFVSFARLEEGTPPPGIAVIYDRAATGGASHVVSLKPGEETPSVGAAYQGVSADGSVVAFKLTEAGTTTMFVRLHNSRTLEVASGETVFGGISGDGRYVFYLRPGGAPVPGEPPRGDILRFDTETEATTEVGSGGESILVNVAADGSRAYFVSPDQLDGANGISGQENLYLWDGSTPRFIATLTQRDVLGEPAKGISDKMIDGLGLWVEGPATPSKGQYAGPGSDPSRATADGSTLLFESRATLGGYDSGGQAEIYRYDAGADHLVCVSCNPTGSPATSDAQLQSIPPAEGEPFPPLNVLAQILNLSSDGEKAFFQSADRLVPRDTDGRIDVYEWRAEGAGGCVIAGGCLALVSSGQSSADDYLFAVTPDGANVFFHSADLLVPEDKEGTPSIYDARVGGGPPPSSPAPLPCAGDACQGSPAVPPALPGAGGQTSATLMGDGNAKAPRRKQCPKGKRHARRGGKAHCETGKKRHSSHRRGGAGR